jgi:glycosyltransferase involved in cell wall biosynthesis
MRAVVVVVPGPIGARTGGSIYDRRIVDGLRSRGWNVGVREVEPRHDGDDVYAALPDGALVLADGLVFSARPELAERHASRLRFVPLVHLPLAEEPGLTPERAAMLEQGERRAVACAAAVVVTGSRTLDTMTRYGVPRKRIAVVTPGTDRAPLARGSRGAEPGTARPVGTGTVVASSLSRTLDGAVHLLTVATVNAGKGHALLVRALAEIEPAAWRLTCVGSLDRDPAAVARLRALITTLGLAERVMFAGELDDAGVSAAYDAADVFVLPTLHETFGMAVAEAIARGLPVVSTPTGAIAEIAGDGALLVPPGDVVQLSVTLRRVIGDPTLRNRLAAGARAARERLTSWDTALDKMCAVLTAVADGRIAF